MYKALLRRGTPGRFALNEYTKGRGPKIAMLSRARRGLLQVK